MSKKSVLFTTYFYRFLLIASVVVTLGYSIKLLSDKSIWRTEETDPEEDRANRTQSRGLLASLFSAVLSTIISVTMAYFGVSQNGIEILYGFLFSPVLGYLFDIAIGTDTGLRLLKSNFFEGIKYSISRLSGGSFIRFIVSFLLDMYICKPLAAIFKAFSVFNLEKVVWNGMFTFMDKFALQNVTSIVQTIVGLITFQTYTNQSRFLWAYPEKTLPKEKRLSSFSIMSLTSLAAVFYISQYSKEVTSLSMHMFLAILSFIFLSSLYLTGSMDEEYVPPEQTEEEANKPKYTNGQLLFGIVALIVLVFVGLIYPFMSRSKENIAKEVKFSNAMELGKFMRENLSDPITQKVIGLMDMEEKMLSNAAKTAVTSAVDTK